MKNAPKLLALTALIAVSNAVTAPSTYAGPMGPSAKMAARLKKRPTSTWLAHYLPDDRYKIAGGVWKFVSTDLDTYYHRPDSPLMMNQSAGRVIGFSSVAEAEEAGYRPGPSVLQGATQGGGAVSSGQVNSQMAKVFASLKELQSLGGQMKGDRTGNFSLMKQRLQRALVLMDSLPVSSREKVMMTNFKNGIRQLIGAIDLQLAGNETAARQKAMDALPLLQASIQQSQQLNPRR